MSNIAFFNDMISNTKLNPTVTELIIRGRKLNISITNNLTKQTITQSNDDYTNGCLQDYNYFKNYYKLTAIDLSKKQGFHPDPKAI